MNKTRIFLETPLYEIISHGGIAYEIIRSGDFASLFLQGDDADTFFADMARAAEKSPLAMRIVCEAYDDVMGVAE